jgi:hypothetical protein
MTDKKVKLNLVGIDSNAFAIMGTFRSQARREHWTQEEIDEVLTEARNGDYSHLLCTIMDHCDMDEEDDDCDGCGSCGDDGDECDNDDDGDGEEIEGGKSGLIY